MEVIRLMRVFLQKISWQDQARFRYNPSPEAFMQISALVQNSRGSHQVSVTTADKSQSLTIPGKATGSGSAVNGGEFLMLALATCFCNDIYREAERMKVPVESVEVEARADFAGVGLAASNVTYRARVVSPASDAEVDALLSRTDAVAEIHNTLRAGAAVVRRSWHDESREHP
jgi:organic hydroperoxide reductase OsmC/OhrA